MTPQERRRRRLIINALARSSLPTPLSAFPPSSVNASRVADSYMTPRHLWAGTSPKTPKHVGCVLNIARAAVAVIYD